LVRLNSVQSNCFEIIQCRTENKGIPTDILGSYFKNANIMNFSEVYYLPKGRRGERERERDHRRDGKINLSDGKTQTL
jgi:hypothetical protein